MNQLMWIVEIEPEADVRGNGIEVWDDLGLEASADPFEASRGGSDVTRSLVIRATREQAAALGERDDVLSVAPHTVGRREAADLLGTTPGTIDTWRARYPAFPKPVRTIGGTPIWRWNDIAEWHARPRPAGRPRKR